MVLSLLRQEMHQDPVSEPHSSSATMLLLLH